MRGIINIIVGIAMIIGGLTGKFVLIFTESGGALALLGAALAGWGVVTLVRGNPQK